MVGHDWDLLDEVWPPFYGPGGELYAHTIPFAGMSSFLEMGCGTGVMSVLAAKAGCQSVVGLDLNPAAVRNTELNAVRHGVADRVTARVSDMYSAVEPGERFDGIYWNPPFLDAPKESMDSSIWHETMFDPEFSKLRHFLEKGVELLTPGGRIYLWFGEALGNPTLVRDLADEAGLDLRILETLATSAIPDPLVELFVDEEIEEDSAWHLHMLELCPR
ncbi:methyltransferase [Nonomuraea terrae]|uniref:methyltransferase n=1 Tax=Nonomuraea terrae TaxID=2530383 RepID=UPI0037B5A392